MNNDISITLGEKIASTRKAHHMTQSDLAEKLNVTPQAISKWETGKGLPDLTLLPVLAAALELGVGELLGEAGVSPLGDSSSAIPPTLNGLPLAGEYHGTACYSAKTVEHIQGHIIDFTDGSQANLKARSAINCGQGEISFSDWEPPICLDHGAATETREETFPACRALHIKLGMSCHIEVAVSGREECRVIASGTPTLLSHLETRAKTGTLWIITHRDLNMRHEGNEPRSMIKIYLPLANTAGDGLYVEIDGAGTISVAPAFGNSTFHIQGSGIIEAGETGTTNASIAGSGSISLGNACGVCRYSIAGSGAIRGTHLGDEVALNIAGSGDISAQSAANVEATIAGSGDISLGRVSGGKQSVSIAGSGDLSIHQIEAEGLSAKVSGSGDITCYDGAVTQLTLNLAGAGGFDGHRLCVDTADLTSTGTSEIVIGHIKSRSVERIGKRSTLRVLKRGE